MTIETIRVPDIGSDDAVDVIEIPVKAGDSLEAEATIVVLESDKATVEVPLPVAGKVMTLLVKVGDRVKQGDPLLELETGAVPDDVASSAATPKTAETAPETPAAPVPENKAVPHAAAVAPAEVDLVVPDLGDIAGAEVIELAVKVGDDIAVDQIVAVLESDKASVEIPSSVAGKLQSLTIKVGDKLNSGAVIGKVLSAGVAAVEVAPQATASAPPAKPPVAAATPGASVQRAAPQLPAQDTGSASGTPIYAGPAVRKLARELGVDLSRVAGTGPKGRVLRDDVHAWVKQALSAPAASAPGTGLSLDLPEIDFSKFGPVERVEQNKLRKLSATNLHRSWLTIPHVTQHDETDITALEAFRVSENERLKKEGVKLTMLAFLVRACAVALQKYPKFNSSLTPDGEALIYKQYINIGVAVETENGLVVPVVKDADKKGIVQIAQEVAELAAKARNRKLTPGDMQGGTFSISSLGGIGGTAFTPIVNWPEVAILGVSKSQMKPVWNGEKFKPRLTLPLSLSYDHRVIDGADAARFVTYLGELLADMRRALL